MTLSICCIIKQGRMAVLENTLAEHTFWKSYNIIYKTLVGAFALIFRAEFIDI